MFRAFFCGVSLLSGSLLLPLARADWADESGFTALQAELGAAMPTGVGVRVAQVEALLSAGQYAPVTGSSTVAGSGTFTGKSFIIKSGASTASFHAVEVGQSIYGLPPSSPRYGMATGVNNIDCYEVNNWIGNGFLRTGSLNAPVTETAKVQNHSWIYIPPDNTTDASLIEMLRRSDYSINTNNYVACVGMANDGGSTVPVLMATGVNSISVGLTSGGHSRGMTAAAYDLPGRMKPEIVVPLDFTSFATGLVSGSVAVLRSAATTTNAQRNEILRAIVLAGATKAEFTAWSRTTTHPLDAIYGAGELNIANSYHILAGGEQAPSPTTPVALVGWDLVTLNANSTADYLLTLPSTLQGASLSAVLVWNRQITRNVITGALTPVALPNLKLTLYKGTTNPGTLWDSSDSPVDNLEHVWQPALTCGTYRLRITGDASAGATAALAWRVTAATAAPSLKSNGLAANGTVTFSMASLVPSQFYELQTSADLVSWTNLTTFTATTLTQTWQSDVLPNQRYFFRLKWSCP